MKCPRCNNECEEFASICPNCGFDFTEKYDQVKTEDDPMFVEVKPQIDDYGSNMNKKSIFSAWWFWLVIIGILVIILSILIAHFKDKNADTLANNEHSNTTSSEMTTNKSNKIFNTINFNDVINIPNFVEFSISEAVWSEKVLPSNTSDFYSYLEDVDGEIYFTVKGTIKNESGEEISPEDIVGKALFNDKYEYNIQVKAEGEDSSDFYCFALDPLKQTKLYMVISVPDKIRTDFKKCEITFGFNDKMLLVEENTLIENLPYKYVLVVQK